MIGSGTQADPWVPLNAAELKDCWSSRGGYIDLTCDIDMGDIEFGPPMSSPKVTLNLNGFSLYISKTFNQSVGSFIFCYADRQVTVKNGIVYVSNSIRSVAYLTGGDYGSTMINIIIVNDSNYFIYVSKSTSGDRANIVCINKRFNQSSIDRYSCVYQDKIYSGNFFKINNATPNDIEAAGLPRELFYIENYLGGKNICIEKAGKSFVSGVTSVNGIAVKMELTVVGTKSSARWHGNSDNDGKFNLNLGVYSDPVSVFATDIINKKLRGNNSYSVGDVAIPSPDGGIKFTCTVAGITSDLPNPLPTTGTVTIGTAVFEVKNISPSSCAGPMIPANKYSNYGIKSK